MKIEAKQKQDQELPIRYIAENALGDVQFDGTSKQEAVEAFKASIGMAPFRVIAVLVEDGPAAICSIVERNEANNEDCGVPSEPDQSCTLLKLKST